MCNKQKQIAIFYIEFSPRLTITHLLLPPLRFCGGRQKHLRSYVFSKRLQGFSSLSSADEKIQENSPRRLPRWRRFCGINPSCKTAPRSPANLFRHNKSYRNRYQPKRLSCVLCRLGLNDFSELPTHLEGLCTALEKSFKPTRQPLIR